MKHIELDCHFICAIVAQGQLITGLIPSADQVVDIFTKPLPKEALILSVWIQNEAGSSVSFSPRAWGSNEAVSFRKTFSSIII